jgi:hypothetical protein
VQLPASAVPVPPSVDPPQEIFHAHVPCAFGSHVVNVDAFAHAMAGIGWPAQLSAVHVTVGQLTTSQLQVPPWFSRHLPVGPAVVPSAHV